MTERAKEAKKKQRRIESAAEKLAAQLGNAVFAVVPTKLSDFLAREAAIRSAAPIEKREEIGKA